MRGGAHNQIWVSALTMAWQAPGVERDDYTPWIGRRLPLGSAMDAVTHGHYPPGLVLECQGAQYTVMGEYGRCGHLIRIGRRG